MSLISGLRECVCLQCISQWCCDRAFTWRLQPGSGTSSRHYMQPLPRSFHLKVLYVIFFHCIKHKIPYVCRLGNMLNSHTCFPEKNRQPVILLYTFHVECLFLVWSVWLRPLPVYPIVFQQPGLPVVKDRRFYRTKSLGIHLKSSMTRGILKHA